MKDLQQKAMLVDLTIGNWTGSRKDKMVTNSVISQSRAAKDTGGWTTKLVPKSSLKGIQRASNKAREYHLQHTLPWSDEGYRLLPAKMFQDYSAALREIEKKYWEAVNNFCSDYPRIIEESKERLGDLYREEFMPSIEVVRSKFSWNVDIMPLPAGKDFRVDLNESTVKDIQQEIEAKVEERVQSSVEKVWQRLYRVVNKASERLSDSDKVFRNSLIGNIRELCDVLPKFNLTDDPELNRMTEEVSKKLGNQSPEELRTDKVARKEVADEASKILGQMSGYMGDN